MTIPPDHSPITIDTLKAEVSRLRVEGHISHDTFEALFQMLEDAKRNEWR